MSRFWETLLNRTALKDTFGYQAVNSRCSGCDKGMCTNHRGHGFDGMKGHQAGETSPNNASTKSCLRYGVHHGQHSSMVSGSFFTSRSLRSGSKNVLCLGTFVVSFR
jgi:hypothetical protein